jgi:putative protease
MKKVELLAPARNVKAIKAAIEYADSFYFGLKDFNMRMKSENIALHDLSKVVHLCHDHDLKAYLATNILIYDNEITQIREMMEQVMKADVDAVIVNDLAALQIARQVGIPFHVSTQCNVSNSLAAKFYEDLGAKRIILARELSLEKIKEIKRNLNRMQVETFIHGAMCTSVSGRCYFSQDICGAPERSANRGSCIQPCRRRWWVRDESGVEYIYDGVRFMNSRDLCTIAHIPELVDAGIDAFKIEGRRRHPHYVEVVTKVYREAIEAHYEGTFRDEKVRRWVTELKKVYNRGFTPGFYFKRATEEDQQHKSPANLSHYRYIRVGKISEFNPETLFATVILSNGSIKKTDNVIILGKNSETYVHQTENKMYLDGNLLDKSPRGRKSQPYLIYLKVNGDVEINDNVYIFTDKTYKSRSYSL